MEEWKIPRTIQRTGDNDTWDELAKKALKKLGKGLCKKGLVAKLDYSDSSKDVYFLTSSGNGWKCVRAADKSPKEIITSTPKHVEISFEPFVDFIKNEEIRAFTSPSNKQAEYCFYDLYYVPSSLNNDGEVEWLSALDGGVRKIRDKEVRDPFTKVKTEAMKAMGRHKKHWTGCLRYLIFRIDMSIDSEGDMGMTGKGYLNEIEVFPNCSTFLINTQKDFGQIIKLARCTQLFITERHQVGEYFCL